MGRNLDRLKYCELTRAARSDSTVFSRRSAIYSDPFHFSMNVKQTHLDRYAELTVGLQWDRFPFSIQF